MKDSRRFLGNRHSFHGSLRTLRQKISSFRSLSEQQALQLVFTYKEAPMSDQSSDDGSKKVKNIAAVLYLLVLTFLVGGSYINQHRTKTVSATSATVAEP
ncbi:MAG: hypothetical protein ACXV7F_07180 [Methylomonas sp.]